MILILPGTVLICGYLEKDWLVFQPASIIPRPQMTHLPFTLLKIVLNFICISPIFGGSGLEFGLVFNGHFQCEVPFWHILIAPSSCLPFLWLSVSRSLQRDFCSPSWLLHTANYMVGRCCLLCLFVCFHSHPSGRDIQVSAGHYQEEHKSRLPCDSSKTTSEYFLWVLVFSIGTIKNFPGSVPVYLRCFWSVTMGCRLCSLWVSEIIICIYGSYLNMLM